MPSTTTKYAISEPLDSDFISGWPATMRLALEWLDANIATAISTDPRPAAGRFGRLHRAPDGTISFDDGSAWIVIRSGLVSLNQLGADVPLPNVGDQLVTGSSVLPANGKWAWANGALIRGDLYPVFLANVGHAYNGGANPGVDGSGNQLVKLPDKRGRGSIGATTMPSGTGVTGNDRAQIVRGGVGGEVVHTLTSTQSGTPASVWIPSPTDGGAPYGVVTGQVDQRPFGVRGAQSAASSHNNLQPYEGDNVMVRIA